jgi:FAD/FMN-containing dehydrogenase
MPHPADATRVPNWFGDIVSRPTVVVEATSVQDVVRILQDPRRYPSPVRAFGSHHSTTACATADGGTMINMRGMNRVLKVTDDSVTVQAGALLIDVAKALEARGLQFYVNTEIGNLSMGSAACAGTKDSSMPGESGQVCSYCTRMQVVLPSGEVLTATEEDDPELMQLLRCSYGTFGIVTEATFRVRRLRPLEVFHETYSVRNFAARLPELWQRGYALMYYMFLFDEYVTVELRKYNPRARGKPDTHVWPLRNTLWATVGPRNCYQTERTIEDRAVRAKVLDAFGGIWRWNLEHLVRSTHTRPGDQMIRYPDVADDSRYTFSFWAFPEETYPTLLPRYTRWVKQYDRTRHYRTNMLHVGYRVLQDRHSLLSYSFDGNAMTIDPVSTGNPGWTSFLSDFNAWCSDHGGIPLANQTPGLTREQAQRAWGERLDVVAAARAEFDPGNRLLNGFFRAIFGVQANRTRARGKRPDETVPVQDSRP